MEMYRNPTLYIANAFTCHSVRWFLIAKVPVTGEPCEVPSGRFLIEKIAIDGGGICAPRGSLE